MRVKGRIRSWNDQKGFGFIEPDHSGKQVFIHVSAFSNRHRKPTTGELVTYALSTDREGRPCAARATLPGDTLPKRAKRSAKALAVIGAILFLCVIGISVARVQTTTCNPWALSNSQPHHLHNVCRRQIGSQARSEADPREHVTLAVIDWRLAGRAHCATNTTSQIEEAIVPSVFWITVVLNVGMHVWILIPGGLGIVQSWIGGGHSVSRSWAASNDRVGRAALAICKDYPDW